MGMIVNKDIDITFDKMEAAVYDIEQTALNVGAYYLKDKVKESFTSKFPNATKPVRQQTVSRGYKITKEQPLVDAVRQSRYKNNTVKVHILGAGEPGSPLFMTRFYESGTKERYAKTYKGQKLNKKRRLGSIKGYNFFMPTIDEQIDETTRQIGEVYEHKIDEIFNNG